MPLENLEEEGLPKNPDLRIAQLKFLLTMDGHRQDAKVKTELMDAIKANSELAHRCFAGSLVASPGCSVFMLMCEMCECPVNTEAKSPKMCLSLTERASGGKQHDG